jgi:spermidine dehydrogenase
MAAGDKELGMGRRITRRDFLNGIAMTATASLSMPFLLEAFTEDYPPALTGLRGSNEGSYEVAHQLKDGNLSALFRNASNMGEEYDLVIVGAGVSGLAAAWFYRKAVGPRAKILILDNHDDFGGHARRQEFTNGKSFLLGHGGSFAIESPAPYSKTAKGLIEELVIDVKSFSGHLDSMNYSSHGLRSSFFFDQPTFGKDLLLPDPFDQYSIIGAKSDADSLRIFLQSAPLNDVAKRDLQRLLEANTDYMPGSTSREKKSKLAQMSYASYITDVAKCDSAILPVFQARPHALYGAGIDVVPAQDAWGLGFPGFEGLHLDPEPGAGMNRDAIPNEEAEKYFFHFPDGNASIARLLVRRLIPETIPGSSSEDIVMARARYSNLDRKESRTRIRLSSTVIHAEQENNHVELTYVRKGKAQKVRASGCVLACWHTMIPYLCPDLPRDQKTALAYAIKIPLLFTRVALRNWTSWTKLKTHSVYAPGNYFSDIQLPLPLKFQGYRVAQNPEDPILISMFRAPCKPGLPIRQQHRLGRRELLGMKWEDYERKIRQELLAILGPGGFDPAKDIAGIAVFRWPHGYAYQYNSLFDPFWAQGDPGPCILARKSFGRITIANSDAGAYAYLDCAIDQGYRAVQELLQMT